MKKLFNPYLLLSIIYLFVMFSIIGCANLQGIPDMSNKQKLSIAYSTYNSQYALYMFDTGYVLNDVGKWEKISSPELSDDKKEMLRKKKDILTKMHPLIRVYDNMVNGIIPYSSATEADLFALIDQLATLVPD